MSSFDTLESSLEDSRPLEIYTFAVGLEAFRFTSTQSSVTIGTDTWSPESVSRGQISQGADERNRNLVITVPADNDFASKYIDVPPGNQATISIIRLQWNESPTFDTQVLIYKGTIQSVRFPANGTAAEITCRSLEAAASQNIPRYTFMSMCNHVLYDTACGVGSGSNTYAGVVTLVSDLEITITGLDASGIDATGGYAQDLTNNDFRMVLSQTGDVITVLSPFTDDVTSSNVQVFRGCDHTLTGDCAVQFDNVAEYGGCSFVPSKNIFSTGLDD